jgi:hypothetical protein
MSISGLLNILAERALIACDAAYFTNTNVTDVRPAGDTDSTHLYKCTKAILWPHSWILRRY